MKTQYIVMLREEVHTGTGFAKRLDVESYENDADIASFIRFKTTDGKTIWINKNNVKSIAKVEGGK